MNQSPAKPTVMLADDHKIVLEGLRVLLQPHFDLVGTVTDGRELLVQAPGLQPDLIVADISMPLLNGIDAVRQLREQGLTSKVVFLTMHSDQTYATRAIDAGAAGYVLKHSASDELVGALRDALAGKTFISPALRNPALEEKLTGDKVLKPVIELTARQREVLQLLAEGKSAKEIGAVLDISPRTAEAHKYRIMDELGVKTGAELIQYAIRHGLVSV